MAKCDVCGQHVSYGDVTALLDIYRQPGLEDVCGECGRWANSELDAIRKEQCAELKRRICERAGRPRKKKRWWVTALECLALALFLYGFISAFNYLIDIRE